MSNALDSIICFLVGIVSSALSAKIIATYYMKIIDSYLDKDLELTKSLIRWAKGLDKQHSDRIHQD